MDPNHLTWMLANFLPIGRSASQLAIALCTAAERGCARVTSSACRAMRLAICAGGVPASSDKDF